MVRRFGADRFGGVAVMVALALPVLLGFGAIGTEVGMWLLTQRRMQGAADAAAVSATFTRTSLTTIQNQAYAVAAQNGYSNGVNGVTVTVHNPPTQGHYTTNNQAIEVIIQQPQGRLLSALFLGTNPTVAARGVAAPSANSGGCVLGLAPLPNASITVSGNGTVTLNGCDADSNGNLNLNGSNSGLSANRVDLAGTKSGNGTLTTTKPPVYNDATAFTDPYLNVQSSFPAMPGTCVAMPASGTITAGCYKGGTTITGNLSMGPGLYYIDGKFGAFSQTGGIISGTGVTIFLTSSTPATASTIATISINGGSGTQFNITAPSSGVSSGLAVIQDNRATQGSAGAAFAGQASIGAVGVFYFPKSGISFTGNNVTVTSSCINLIGWTVAMAGNATMSNNCTGDGVNPFGHESSFRLVE
ncbi:MAG TPA: pilus assembly protein TadG-related protein [Aliidongia sp.]|nr:pilus assembly protein TadG-related protein [Aliidongia sp.]